MPSANVGRLRAAPITLRRGNRRAKPSFWSEGSRLFTALSATILCLSFALVFVWTNHQAVQTGLQIADLHKERAEMVDLNRRYKVELANLTSLDRLEETAKAKLGLVAPSPEQVQVIE